MGKLVRTSTPLLFQSKLLCSSLSYLFLSLFFAFYTSLSPTTKCHFRSCPFDPLQSPLFIYPQSYGQQKHPIPTIKSSCNSPVFFSGNVMFILDDDLDWFVLTFLHLYRLFICIGWNPTSYWEFFLGFQWIEVCTREWKWWKVWD